MAALKLLSFLAFVALVALSSGPVHVNALVADRAQVARHAHAHEAVAKRKRDSSTPSSSGRCQPRPTSSLVPSSLPTSTPSLSPPTSTTPPPAPSTTSSTATSTGSNKKFGLAWNADPAYLGNFANLPNVQYIYNWGYTKPSGLDQYPGLNYMPMLWGPNFVSGWLGTVVQGYAKYALGFNEPNEPSQSNMSPQSAANLWIQYMNPLKPLGYTLGSPACTDDDAGLAWYQQFFSACAGGCIVDFMAFHAYTTDPQHLIDYATQLHNNYSMPVMITEFADTDFSYATYPDMSQVWNYAGTVTAFIANTEWMQGACPFGEVSDLQGVDTNNALMTSAGTPTDLAYYYFG